VIFLIQFDPQCEQLKVFERFEDALRATAQAAKQNLELDLLRQGIRDEVVILEAASEDVIRRTHRRYFETLEEMLEKKAS
jgi:hypothetical protein